VVQLWDRNSQRVTQIDTGEKALTFLAWSKTGPELAIGSAKGNLYLYDKRSTKMVPIKGKHTKKITCGPPTLRRSLSPPALPLLSKRRWTSRLNIGGVCVG